MASLLITWDEFLDAAKTKIKEKHPMIDESSERFLDCQKMLTHVGTDRSIEYIEFDLM